MIEWKLIEEAPKDGTEILAWCENNNRNGPEIVHWNCVYGSWVNISSTEGWNKNSIKGWIDIPKYPRTYHLCFAEDGSGFSCVYNEIADMFVLYRENHNTLVEFCPFCGVKVNQI